MQNASIMVAVAVLAAGCGGAPVTPAPLSNSTRQPGRAAPQGLFLLDVGSVGPLTADTAANLTAIRAVLNPRGLTVRPVNRSGVEYHAFLGDELVLYVIPNDDGTLFNVHVTSPRVTIAEHPQWKIGGPFTGHELLSTCECWGTAPVCFKVGDHVAVAFDRACDDLREPAARKALEGVRVQRAVWSPTPFKLDADADGFGGNGYGGDGYGDPCGGDGSGDPCGP